MKKPIISLFGILVFLLSCHKEIEFKGRLNHDSKIFIESILYPGEIPKVHLSKSMPFFNEKVTPQDIFARNAIVKISDKTLEQVLVQDSTFDKFRCRWIPFYKGDKEIQYGKSYELTVQYDHQTFMAETTIDQPKVNIEEVVYTPEFYDVYGGHDGVILRLKDSPGEGNFYRFQMDRWIDNTRHHAHVLEVVDNDCTTEGELFLTKDLGRTIFSDANVDNVEIELYVEVSFEYLKGDSATIFIQSLDKRSAVFFQELDNQLQSIQNPFVEPSFLHSTIEGTIGVFGSAVRSDPVLFIYPQDNP